MNSVNQTLCKEFKPYHFSWALRMEDAPRSCHRPLVSLQRRADNATYIVEIIDCLIFRKPEITDGEQGWEVTANGITLFSVHMYISVTQHLRDNPADATTVKQRRNSNDHLTLKSFYTPRSLLVCMGEGGRICVCPYDLLCLWNHRAYVAWTLYSVCLSWKQENITPTLDAIPCQSDP